MADDHSRTAVSANPAQEMWANLGLPGIPEAFGATDPEQIKPLDNVKLKELTIRRRQEIEEHVATKSTTLDSAFLDELGLPDFSLPMQESAGPPVNYLLVHKFVLDQLPKDDRLLVSRNLCFRPWALAHGLIEEFEYLRSRSVDEISQHR